MAASFEKVDVDMRWHYKNEELHNPVMLLTVTIAACAALPRTGSGWPQQITTVGHTRNN